MQPHFSARQQCRHRKAACVLLLFFPPDAFPKASLSAIWKGWISFKTSVVYGSNTCSKKTFRLYDKYKSRIHQIHSGTDFPYLHELSQKYVRSDSVAVWPWNCVWESLWCSQKDLPLLLTACLTLSAVHNGSPHSKPLIYTVSIQTPLAHCKENKLRKQVFGRRDDTPGKTGWCWMRLGIIPEIQAYFLIDLCLLTWLQVCPFSQWCYAVALQVTK